MGKPQIVLHVHVWVGGVHFKPIKTCLAFTTANTGVRLTTHYIVKKWGN